MKQVRTPAGATLRCTNCRQTWLVPGLRPGETHICKGCGHPLLVGERTESAPDEKEGRDVCARVPTRTAARCES